MLARLGTSPSFLRFFRLSLLLTGIFYTVLAIAFVQRWAITRDLWPWTGTYSTLNGLASIFFAATAAATAASLFWTAANNEPAAATGGGINLLIVFGGSGLFFLQSYLTSDSVDRSRLLVAAVISGLLTIGAVAVLRIGTTVPFRDTRPQPRLVRISFALFILVLMGVGTASVLKIQGIIPWNLSVEALVIYGWIFLGAALYFGYAWLKPNWANTSGQLAGFLAYDLLLIYPFLTYLPSVPARFRLSLIIYTVILIYSGLLAIYYLFINPKTRFQRTKSTTS